MAIAFLPGVHAAAIGRDLVVCDLAHDRWLACIGALDTVSGGTEVMGFRLSDDTVAALVEVGLAGIPDPVASAASPVLPRAVDELTADAVPPMIRIRDVRDLILALIEAGYRLATRRYATRPHLPGSVSSPLGHPLADDVARAARLLLFVPWCRRCLPRALILRAFLQRRGHATRIVFAARLRPFDAHCWLQVGECVIGDRLDHVGGYVPIFSC